jgi:hypothetical protein
MIKEFCFGLWATLWVWIDELGKMLGGTSIKEIAKLTLKLSVYTLSAVAWLFIIYAMLIVGYAV